MDALSDVLRAARFTGGVFLHADMSAPWCMASQMAAERCSPFLDPSARIIPYHYLLEGSCEMRVDGETPVTFTAKAGDVVLFPHGGLHTLGSDLRLPPVQARDVVRPGEDGSLKSIALKGGGAVTRIVCGFLGFDDSLGNPVISALPPMLRIDIADAIGADWILATFRFAAEEVAARRPGSDALLAKVSELLFIEAVRRYVETLPEDRTGWLTGMRDRHVAKALALFHGSVAHGWTIEELGREVGLSRSALVERFTRLIGVPPMQYLSNWRMQLAQQMLRTSSTPMAEIAYRVGYGSDAAFSRAFKKAFGAAPSTQRRSVKR